VEGFKDYHLSNLPEDLDHLLEFFLESYFDGGQLEGLDFMDIRLQEGQQFGFHLVEIGFGSGPPKFPAHAVSREKLFQGHEETDVVFLVEVVYCHAHHIDFS